MKNPFVELVHEDLKETINILITENIINHKIYTVMSIILFSKSHLGINTYTY